MTIRTDQIVELEAVQEKLVDILVREADPAEWVRDTKENRKERLEQKRSAAATLTIITKISSVLGFLRGQQPPADPGDDAQASNAPTREEILAAADEARTLLANYGSGERKA